MRKGITTGRVSTKRVLAGAKNLSEALVIGQNRKGELEFYGTNGDPKWATWAVESFKQQLLAGDLG